LDLVRLMFCSTSFVLPLTSTKEGPKNDLAFHCRTESESKLELIELKKVEHPNVPHQGFAKLLVIVPKILIFIEKIVTMRDT
jgi:hypothetical protein